MTETPTIDWTENPDVVLIDGSEEYFKDELVSQAKRVFEDHQKVHLRASVDSDNAIKAHLFEGSLIPTKKLIIISDANRVDSSEFLERYCDSPNPNHIVVLVASGGRKPKWFRSLKHDQKVKCTSPKPWEYKDWMVNYCRENGYDLDEDYANSIHENVGDDLYAISNELEKIFLNMGNRTLITPGDITSVLVQHEAISPFHVIESWGQQKTDASLRMASIYFHQSSDRYAALPVVAMFLGQIEKLIAFESYKQNEYSKKEIRELMSISSYVYDKVERQAVHWNLRTLRKAYAAMCDIESKVKKGKNGKILIDWFLSQDFQEKSA